MIVQPGLLTDPKYLQLRKALLALSPPLVAAEVLLRLWGHCQHNQRGEFWEGRNAKYVESVCLWEGADGRLFDELVTIGWVDVEASGVRIHDWDENNSSLTAKWRANRSGKNQWSNKRPPTDHPPTGSLAGHRPPTDHPPTGSLAGHRPPTDHPPTGSLAGHRVDDRLEGVERGSGGTAAPAILESPFPEAEAPSEAQVLVECGLRGYPDETGSKFWRHYESGPGWEKIRNWRLKLNDWVVTDRQTPGWQATGDKKTPPPALAQLEAELAVEADPAKRKTIREKIAALG